MKNRTYSYRIHLHDFAGHPFQAELSNAFAARGHRVLHSFFYHLGGGKGLLEDVNRTGNIDFLPINLRGGYENKKLLKRLLFELRLASKLIFVNRRFSPDILIVANLPLITAVLLRLFSSKAQFILWHQDVISQAFLMLKKNEKNKLNRIAKLQFYLLSKLESELVKRSNGVICVSEAFVSLYHSWKVDMQKVLMLENWAPLEQFPYSKPRKGSYETLKFVYAGTLGMKHNPSILVKLIDRLNHEGRPSSLKVVSQGDGANFLKNSKVDSDAIELLDFVSIVELNKLLRDADVALVLLEEGASNFSVPSKAYTYLSSGKLVIAFAPSQNAASRAIAEAGGYVFSPDEKGVRAAVQVIFALNEEVLHKSSISSRHYAEEHFSVDSKVEAFLKLIEKTKFN